MENPKIRFKGFTKDWEQRNVSEITKFHKQGFYTTEEYDNSKKYYLLRGTDLTENKLVLKDTPKIDATEKDYDAFKTEIGDFLIVRSGTVGTYGIVDVDIPAIFGSYLIDFRFDMEQVTNEFFGYFYQSSLFKSQLNKIIQASANTNINAENIKSTVISLPSLNEQRRISEYLGNLDNLITLHQRKCEQTKKLKKYMLQKMFPQNGAKVPEIRFYGFTYDWEQRKLGEIATETYGGGTPKTSNEEFWKGDIPWIQSSDLIDECLFDVRPRKCISQEAVSKSATKLVPQNSIAIVTRVGVGKLAFMPFSYATSQDFLSLSGLKIDPEFTVYALYKMMQSVSNEVQGTSIKGVTKDELLAKKIIFPSCNEQKKIGAYLHSLDNLITLHQRKCDELKKMKKYMLQNMFI